MFCVKRDTHMFDGKVICLNPRKMEQTVHPVGRPRKYDNSISVNELRDFNDLLEFDKWYNEKYSKLYIDSTEPKTTRKRLSSQKKEELKHFHLASGNYQETARAFQLQDSTVRKICKAAPPNKSEIHQGFKGEKEWKGNAKGAGRPLSYPASIDEELLSWLLITNDIHLPVSLLALQKKTKSLILPHNPCFENSRGWVHQLKERHNLALRKKIFVSKTSIPT